MWWMPDKGLVRGIGGEQVGVDGERAAGAAGNAEIERDRFAAVHDRGRAPLRAREARGLEIDARGEIALDVRAAGLEHVRPLQVPGICDPQHRREVDEMRRDGALDAVVLHIERDVAERHGVRRRRSCEDQGEKEGAPAQQQSPHRIDRVAGAAANGKRRPAASHFAHPH